jgi:signal transduction histidine kinase
MLKLFGYGKKDFFEDCDARMIYKSETDYTNAGKIIYHDLKKNGKADFDFELKKKDGSSFNAHVIITGSDTDNPFESTIVTITDISQRQIVQQERYEKERLQGVLELAGAVCHEINQPLQAILGYSELLLIGSKPDDLKDNKLISIKAQATRLGEITKKLSNITEYHTLEYPGNAKIVDIWNTGNEVGK